MGAKLRLLCAAAALLSAAVPGQPEAQGALLPAGDGDGYGVKLCGREFIRAVIFTCGGSRWKRLSMLATEPVPAVGECLGAGGTARGCGTGAGLVCPRCENGRGESERRGTPSSGAGGGSAAALREFPAVSALVRAGDGRRSPRAATCGRRPCLAGPAEPRARRCGLTSRQVELRQRSPVKYLTGKTFRAILLSRMQ